MFNMQNCGCFAGHAKLMVSLLQGLQENDQRITMLQLVDKMKIKQKELGRFDPLFCTQHELARDNPLQTSKDL